MNFVTKVTGIVVLAMGMSLTGTAFAQGAATPSEQQPSANESSATATTPTTNPNVQGDQSSAAGEPMVLVDPGKIYNENPMGWVGKQVELKTVMVQDTNDSGNFWVGSDSGHRLLVVKQEGNDTLKAMKFHKGDVVSIWGTVEAASRYMSKATTASSGSMNDAQKSTGVFLLANNIQVDSSTHH